MFWIYEIFWYLRFLEEHFSTNGIIQQYFYLDYSLNHTSCHATILTSIYGLNCHLFSYFLHKSFLKNDLFINILMELIVYTLLDYWETFRWMRVLYWYSWTFCFKNLLWMEFFRCNFIWIILWFLVIGWDLYFQAFKILSLRLKWHGFGVIWTFINEFNHSDEPFCPLRQNMNR